MIRSLFRSLTRRGRMEAAMDAEMRFHIEACAADLMKRGLSRDEALRRARLEFGPVEAKKEECRESLGLRLFDELRADLRYAARLLKQSPGFTAVAIVSLALGIGANTAIFAMAHEVLYTKMAVPQASRIRAFNWLSKPKQRFPGPAWGSFGPGLASSLSYAVYKEMRQRNTVMEDLVAFKDVYQLGATVDGHAEPVDAWLVSGNFYPSMMPRIIAGRALAPEDDMPSAAPVAVISDAYWAKRFGRSTAALGKTIYVNRIPMTIVGVNAPEFKGPKAGTTAELFLPVTRLQSILPDPKGDLLSRNYWLLMVMGRLKPGVTDQAANTALTADFTNAFRAALPEKKDTEIPDFKLIDGSRGLDHQTRMFAKPSYFLLALAALVLLIACVNLANLLLARSAARRREMSLRLAMGASRGRVMRQVLTESMLLAVLGGAAGILVGYWGSQGIPYLFADFRGPDTLPHMNWQVFSFAFLVTLGTGLLFGIAPAWRSTRADVNSGLQETGRMSVGRGKALFGKMLVATQVALSMLLLIGAGLFLRTLLNLHSAAIGFNPERILLFDVHVPHSRYSGAESVKLIQQIQDRLAALPGIQSVTASQEALLANSLDNDCFHPTVRQPRGEEDGTDTNFVGSSFFETMRIPIVAGRGITARDNETAPHVAVVNRRLAKAFFGDANPIGQTIVSCEEDQSKLPIQIVGVAADAKYDAVRDDPPPTLYLPYLQGTSAERMTFEIKTAASEASVVSGVREAVASVDRDLPVLDIRTQTQQIEATLSQERVFAILSTGFGVLALILASIGIYGVMSYTVARRTNEIGIRMALGARSGAVLGMILRESLWLTLLGVAVGLAAAAGLAKFAESMLFGLKPRDPLTFAGAAVLLLAVALAAGFTPARRASTVDPMQALRHE
jgi:predicted permease